MTLDDALDKYSAELVEELLETTRKESGELWFYIIRRKMERMAKAARSTANGKKYLFHPPTS